MAMDNWQLPKIGAQIVIRIGEEQITAELHSMTYLHNYGMTYTITGDYKGWQIQATATELLARGEGADGEPAYYTAHGNVDVRLVKPDVTVE